MELPKTLDDLLQLISDTDEFSARLEILSLLKAENAELFEELRASMPTTTVDLLTRLKETPEKDQQKLLDMVQVTNPLLHIEFVFAATPEGDREAFLEKLGVDNPELHQQFMDHINNAIKSSLPQNITELLARLKDLPDLEKERLLAMLQSVNPLLHVEFFFAMNPEEERPAFLEKLKEDDPELHQQFVDHMHSTIQSNMPQNMEELLARLKVTPEEEKEQFLQTLLSVNPLLHVEMFFTITPNDQKPAFLEKLKADNSQLHDKFIEYMNDAVKAKMPQTMEELVERLKVVPEEEREQFLHLLLQVNPMLHIKFFLARTPEEERPAFLEKLKEENPTLHQRFMNHIEDTSEENLPKNTEELLARLKDASEAEGQQVLNQLQKTNPMLHLEFFFYRTPKEEREGFLEKLKEDKPDVHEQFIEYLKQ